MIKKNDSGKWDVDIRPNGTNGKRYRKTNIATKAEALRWEAWIKANKTKSKDWEPTTDTDKRKLSDLIELWYSAHGQNLKDGKNRLLMVNNLCTRLGNPRAENLKSSDFTNYRNERLKTGVSANTINHEHVYLSAIFNELTRIGEWKKENPIAKIRKLKLDEQELTFLTSSQINELLEELKKSKESDCYHIARICLATGARWSEAENLLNTDIKPNSITYRATKNGKNRTVPISTDFFKSLPIREGKVFKYAYSTLKRRIKNLSFTLPPGQMSHVLRHTFASHFIQNGGNILVLQKILGHGSLLMTMRYAHLAPEHLEEAIKFNPIDSQA
ncbi:MAG: tyrosine-type recombinase/integrase [Methylobacter sp.]|uniref:phage integrase n=1 Tax=Methylobacter sp. TaxID=2051955 RepID=UPI0025E93312|nr:tyrosine-type recombinase/integrase [Methylobacter sp.]MCK9619171.1 tyrosine-type recombinase/integrase [Methylobacter sp.]